MMDWYGGHMGTGGWVLMSLFILLLVVAITAIVVVLARNLTSRPGAGTARAVLDERLARGEIDVEEYRRRRELLERPAAH
jgi:putative membrane protein